MVLPLPLCYVIIYCYVLQSDDDCCNNCDEVREAYRKKGWALSNPDGIDQVGISCLLACCKISSAYWKSCSQSQLANCFHSQINELYCVKVGMLHTFRQLGHPKSGAVWPPSDL